MTFHETYERSHLNIKIYQCISWRHEYCFYISLYAQPHPILPASGTIETGTPTMHLKIKQLILCKTTSRCLPWLIRFNLKQKLPFSPINIPACFKNEIHEASSSNQLSDFRSVRGYIHGNSPRKAQSLLRRILSYTSSIKNSLPPISGSKWFFSC